MPDEVAVIIVVLLLLASAAVLARQHWQRRLGDERGLPRELVGAEIAYAEQTFRSVRSRLVARLDRAYRLDGELKLVELKTRPRNVVYMSDIVELSVQRVAVQEQAGVAVSGEAWVVVQNSITGARRAHRVLLLPRADVVQMAQRYRDVVSGRVPVPSQARSIEQCRKCGHRDDCSARFGERPL
jgi:hypothetical protein